ncbi:mite allergen Der p 3-like [Culicoides brevitarsis]|uniref:mite allergen Der p 3-like n=1 Tax=Culicoides brevitarsis TaxID=469753 RepID=UPI00307BDC43
MEHQLKIIFLFFASILTFGEASHSRLPRMINADFAKRGQFPSAVLFQGKTWWKQNTCGAVVIDKNYVLTAAHCVTSLKPKDITLYFDILNRSEMKKATKRSVTNIKVHEKYDPKYKSIQGNDLALLKLNKPLSFHNKKIQPAVLADPKVDYTDKWSELAGWGHTEYKTLSEELRFFRSQILDDQDCKDILIDSTHDLTPDKILCLWVDENAFPTPSAYKGDSGGPVYLNGTNTLVGIISFVYRHDTKPTFNVRIANYIDWIKKNMK